MLYIKKTSQPADVTQAITTITNSEEWRNLSEDDVEGRRNCFNQIPKDILRPPLLRDQHFLCAYCMRKIKDNSHTKVEHVKPLSKDKKYALDYSNYAVVCDGGKESDIQGNKRILSCDSSKGDAELKVLDPFDEECMSRFVYRKDGKIEYLPPDNWTDKQIRDVDDDINITLQLNGKVDTETRKIIQDTSTRLVSGRKNAYQIYADRMEKMNKNGGITVGKIDQDIRRMKAKTEWDEYAGVLLFFMERKKRSLTRQRKGR